MRLFISFLVLTGLIVSVAFRPQPIADPLQQATRNFHLGLENLSEQLDGLHTTAQALSADPGSIRRLRADFEAAREQFKEIELLVEYYDHTGVKRSLNGPPLPSVVPNVPNVIVQTPCGFQPLEELIYADQPADQKTAITELTHQLVADFRRVRQYQQGIRIEYRHLLEAMRQEVVRVFTLGLTGFDTPASGRAIPEAAAAMRGVATHFSYLQNPLFQRDRGLAIVLEARLTEVVRVLEQNPDFDSFDRLAFLRDHINPLFLLLQQAHLALQVETIHEITSAPQPVQFEATNLFDESLLNAGYYANLDLKAPTINHRIALGQLLFFDPVLSSNNQRACASCHQPERAFAENMPKSIGLDGKTPILRNAPSLVNCVYSVGFFHDLREPKLEKQVVHVIKDSTEFDTDFDLIADKLRTSATYRQQFADAYPQQPTNAISAYTIADALACYVASLRSFQSPFDRYVRGDTANIAPAAARGFNVFMGKAACGTCHFAPVFNGTVPPGYDDTETEVLGIPIHYDTLNLQLDADLGRYASGLPRDRADFFKYAFKTPTVRNVALTAPYMHNGALQTLEQVIDFYQRGGGAGMGLDVPHQTLPFDNLQLSAQEQRDLIEFMHALTEPAHAPIFARPAYLPTDFEQHPLLNQRKIGGAY
jgi:cytochrome c peroxidase